MKATSHPEALLRALCNPFLTLTASALLALPPAVRAAAKLDTNVVRFDNNYTGSLQYFHHSTTSTGAGSITDAAATGYWTSMSGSASYGSPSESSTNVEDQL